MATPDWELDVVHRLAALVPGQFTATGDARNIIPGMETPIGGEHGIGLTVVRYVTEIRHDHSGGDERDVQLQILTRFDASGGRPAITAARALARAVRDACHKQGDFTGQAPESMSYLDLWWVRGPVFLEPNYFFHDVTLYARG